MKKNKLTQYHLNEQAPRKRQFDIFDLTEYAKNNIKDNSKPHTHSFYQLIWFHNNQGKHFVDFNSFEIRRNRIFFIAKNQVHHFEERDDYSGVLIHFNESFILQGETDMDVFLNYNLFNHFDTPYYQVSEKLLKPFYSYIEQIESEIVNFNEFGHNAILSNSLKSLLINIEREKRKEKSNSKEIFRKNLTFLEFRSLLEKNLKQHWSISTYAEKLSITPKTLNNIVKTETGKTVSQIIIDRTILEVKRQLIHTNAFVNHIGYDLGFQDPSYFIKYFKKQVKISPSEFRKLFS